MKRIAAFSILTFSILIGCAAAYGESLSLDGAWQIVFDQRNEGRTAGWHKQQSFESLTAKRTIQVPNCWETI
jgi:beta-galactosidase